jgi:hypothetical protein
MQTFLVLVLPSVVVYTLLFGLLSRGSPRPGGVALFWRVGLVGCALGAALWYLTVKTSALVSLPEFVRVAWYGLLLAGAVLTAFAALGTALKRAK